MSSTTALGYRGWNYVDPLITLLPKELDQQITFRLNPYQAVVWFQVQLLAGLLNLPKSNLIVIYRISCYYTSGFVHKNNIVFAFTPIDSDVYLH
jgi:hypothetical protein